MLPNDECGLCTTSEWLVNSSTGGLLKDSLLKAYDVDGELLYLLENYLENRKQRVVLNGQTSEWREINSGVPQGSVLGPLLFLIYINDLPDGITSICKIFADDTSLFSKVLDVNESTKKLNLDLQKIRNITKVILIRNI